METRRGEKGDLSEGPDDGHGSRIPVISRMTAVTTVPMAFMPTLRRARKPRQTVRRREAAIGPKSLTVLEVGPYHGGDETFAGRSGSVNKRQATIEHVAALASVSIKTVSRVFNQEPNVRPKTRDKVLQAARQLEYWPNPSARRLASNRSFVVGLLYDNPESDYVTEIQEGVIAVCRRERYDLLIHPCRLEAPDLIEEIGRLTRHSTVDGFLLTPPVSDFGPVLDLLTERGIEFVRVSQRSHASHAPCVSVDDDRAAREMTKFLLQLGHRHIGFIMGHRDHGSSHDRLQGFRAALEAEGIEPDEALIAQGAYTFESGYEAARRLLDAAPRPTAIFASNDHMAMGVLRAVREAGLRIPQDLSVCGFDDTPMARFAWPPLTTVRQPVQEVASLATELLLGRLQDAEESVRDYRLRSELVRRESTAAPP